MKIGIVGTFVRDRILPWRGEEMQSVGGIFFTTAYLASLAKAGVEVYPVATVGADFYDTVTAGLSDFDNISLEGIAIAERDNTRVTLTYVGPQERQEVTTSPMPAITGEQMAGLHDADAVIINLITGFDIELTALQQFRSVSDCLLYLDFHSRCLGIDADGQRFYRKPDDWQGWVDAVDVLQINEMEARTLAGISYKPADNELIQFGKKIVQLRPSVCHITMADQGSYLFYNHEGAVKSRLIHTIEIPEAVDIIGCGDAFEAAYLMQYLSGRTIVESTEFANKVAALNCTFMGSSQIRAIHRLLEELEFERN
jgi:sugar/nucleoside kinase (ribokinase family)